MNGGIREEKSQIVFEVFAMDMKRDHYEDLQIFKSKAILIWSVALLIFLFTLPTYIPTYYIFLFNLMLVHVIIAVGLNILVGYYSGKPVRCHYASVISGPIL